MFQQSQTIRNKPYWHCHFMAIYINKYSRHVPTEPHGGEVAPAQLPDHMVLVVKQVPDLHRMVPSCNKTDVIFIVYQYYYIIATTITLYIKSIFFFFKSVKLWLYFYAICIILQKLLQLVHVLIAKHVLYISHLYWTLNKSLLNKSL